MLLTGAGNEYAVTVSGTLHDVEHDVLRDGSLGQDLLLHLDQVGITEFVVTLFAATHERIKLVGQLIIDRAVMGRHHRANFNQVLGGDVTHRTPPESGGVTVFVDDRLRASVVGACIPDNNQIPAVHLPATALHLPDDKRVPCAASSDHLRQRAFCVALQPLVFRILIRKRAGHLAFNDVVYVDVLAFVDQQEARHEVSQLLFKGVDHRLLAAANDREGRGLHAQASAEHAVLHPEVPYLHGVLLDDPALT